MAWVNFGSSKLQNKEQFIWILWDHTVNHHWWVRNADWWISSEIYSWVPYFGCNRFLFRGAIMSHELGIMPEREVSPYYKYSPKIIPEMNLIRYFLGLLHNQNLAQQLGDILVSNTHQRDRRVQRSYMTISTKVVSRCSGRNERYGSVETIKNVHSLDQDFRLSRKPVLDSAKIVRNAIYFLSVSWL